MRYLIAAIIFCLMSFGTAAPLLSSGNFFHPEALPSKEMRLAQQSLLKGDGNVGLATQGNEAHYATLDTAITWKGARKYCKNLGYRLCHLKELCAGGEGSEPAGAKELPDKQVFVAIKGPNSNPTNVYAALTANAGDGVCTRKLNPEFANQRADPPKGVTKSLVACCTTKFLQNRGFSAGIVKTKRSSNAAAERYFSRRAGKSRRERRRKAREEKERKEREAREAAERKRKEEEEAERKRKEEEARRLQWDTNCVHSGIGINGKSVTNHAGGNWRTVRSTQIYRQGVIKLAVKVTWMPSHHMMVGFVDADQSCHSHSFVHHIYNGGRAWYTHGGSTLYPSYQGYGQRYFAGDTIGAVLDFNRGTITFFKNGQSMGQAYGGVHSPQHFAVSFHTHGTIEIVKFEGNYN